MISMPVIELPRILTGIQFGMDEVSSVFLLFTSLIWVITGVYAFFYMKNDRAKPRFFTSYFLTMAGNIGLILAQDMVGFYLFFALMTFAAYPLTIHDETPKARYAGKVYIVMALIGETLLISAMMLIASGAESTSFRDIGAAVVVSGHQDIFIGLVLSGLGIKTGALLLHMWLPLAYTAAPVAAAGVLSGAMINAGLLGWVRFLPFGEIALPGWGTLCLVAGIAAAFYGVVVGLLQDDPKTVLAYSSISQMGIMTLVIGVGLTVPEAWSAALSCLLIYATHHAFSKSSLFLGVGVARGMSRNPFLFAGLLLPSLALAGAPFTSGAVAKTALKAISEAAHGGWAGWLEWLLPLTAVGTTTLMVRFFLLAVTSRKAGGTHGPAAGVLLSWAILLVCAGAAGFALPFDDSINAVRLSFSVKNILSALWPVLGGAFLFWIAWRLNKRAAITSRLKIPPGDLLVLIAAVFRRLKSGWNHLSVAFEKWKAHFALKSPGLSIGAFVSNAIIQVESGLARWFFAGIVFLLLAAILSALMNV